MFEVVIGTRSGVYHLGPHGLRSLGLDGQRFWAVRAWRSTNGALTILAGSYESGIFRSDDDGRSWQAANDGLTAPSLRTIIPDPTAPGSLLCGTEPARAFRSDDGGRSWRELEGILALPGYQEWFLPYSPRAGGLRNFYSPDGSRLLASVEVGGLLDSPDGGQTWRYLRVGEDHDIHQITGHPDDPNLLYAALGYAALRLQQRDENAPRLGGIARSRDGGASWEKVQTDYTRAVLVPPTATNLLLAGPSPEVGKLGRIEVSADGGDSWQLASDGIETPMPDMVEFFEVAPDNTVWAVTSGGRLLQAHAGEWHWRSALPAGATIDVQSVSFVAEE